MPSSSTPQPIASRLAPPASRASYSPASWFRPVLRFSFLPSWSRPALVGEPAVPRGAFELVLPQAMPHAARRTKYRSCTRGQGQFTTLALMEPIPLADPFEGLAPVDAHLRSPSVTVSPAKKVPDHRQRGRACARPSRATAVRSPGALLRPSVEGIEGHQATRYRRRVTLLQVGRVGTAPGPVRLAPQQRCAAHVLGLSQDAAPPLHRRYPPSPESARTGPESYIATIFGVPCRRRQ